jgi:hypothetical protein
MSLGVVRYCTPEGGSGYIANPSLPWLSSFVITQQAPVYDQETAWLRDSAPGSYTNYSRFGPPYSIDGGVLPPYFDPPLTPAPGTDANGQPVPTPTGCGMGAVDPGQFEARYGRAEPDESTCLQIQCGAIPQEQAGMQLIMDCANAGWSGARSCLDPVCSPWVNRIPGCAPKAAAAAGPAPVLLRSDVVAPMPSITTAARSGCKAPVSDCSSGISSFVESNPWIALALAFGVGAVLFGGGK